MDNKHPLLDFTQEEVKANYERIHAFRNKDEFGKLHMFFSPHRIPLGLTVVQIRVCLNIAKLKDERDEAERKLELSKIRKLDEFPAYMQNDIEFMTEYLCRLARAHLGGRSFPRALPEELRCLDYMTEERFNQGIVKFLASL